MASPPAHKTEPGVGAREGSLPIAEVARRTGLSKDTLRYYEKAGLIEAVNRSSGGQRRYAASDLDWLAFRLRLRVTGMSIADMKRFAQLRRAGDPSVRDRVELPGAHRHALVEHISALQGHLAALDAKIRHYGSLDEQAGTETS
jgi:DNA-binding transcriptional MerR regulator